MRPCGMKANTPTRFRRPLTELQTGLLVTLQRYAGLKITDRAVREEVLHRAYAIWEREGHPGDRKLANWLEAEAELARDLR